MPEIVYSRHHGSGLTLAEFSVDERTVQQQLREFDPQLRLVWERDDEFGCQVWNVVKVWSADHPAVQILTWREDGVGRPLPLTSRLVDEVKRLREVDTLAASDAANARIRARADKQARDDALAIASEHAPKINRGRVAASIPRDVAA